MNQRVLALRADEPSEGFDPKLVLGEAPPPWDALLEEQRFSELLGDRSLSVPHGLGERALLAPLREFLARPGKQFRRRLVEGGWHLGGATHAMPAALGDLLELVHAGSLIVDDIEDGATERRGGNALHRLHGLPTALNCGNFLYFMPLLLLQQIELPPSTELAIHRQFNATMVRCHYGQALDLNVRVWSLPRRDVRPAVGSATALKTGSLTELAMTVGALAAGAEGSRLLGISRLGRDLGIALQMLDDLTSITNPARLHKGREDVALGRLTWPWAWAADRLDPHSYARLRRNARQASESGTNGHRIDAVVLQLRRAVKSRGTWLVRAYLRTAMARARKVVGRMAALTALEQEVSSLEKSYGSGS